MPKKKNPKCPACGSEDILMTNAVESEKTKKQKRSLGQKIGRSTMNLCTLGMYGAVVPKGDGKEKTKVKTKVVAICQKCGESWDVK